MVGRKRIHYLLKGLYETRCFATVVAHNSKTPQQKFHSAMFGCSPSSVCKRSEQKNRIRRIRDSARKEMQKKKRLFSNVVDEHFSYGKNAQ